MTEIAADETTVPAASAWDQADHPWRRYGARMIDMSLFGLIGLMALGLIVGLLWPEFDDAIFTTWWMQYLIMQPVMIASSAIGTALCVGTWGSTPGKWLFGIKVLDEDGMRLSYRRAFERELNLFWWGTGLGLAPITFYMMIRSFFELENEHRSRWDVKAGSVVLGRPIVGVTYLLIAIGTLIVIAIKVWDVVERLRGLA